MQNKISKLLLSLSYTCFILIGLIFLLVAVVLIFPNALNSISVSQQNLSLISERETYGSILELMDEQRNATPTQNSQAAQNQVLNNNISNEVSDDTTSVFPVIDIGQEMLERINQARRSAGLNPVEWDQFAASVGERHAQEMTEYGYFSHWNLSGFGPDLRYGFSGGYLDVMENISSYYERFDDGTPVLITDWDNVILQAHEGLMNSPGHRKNILDPNHTHVGVGFSYNTETGVFALAQEFINNYIVLQSLPEKESPGSILTIHGTLFHDSDDPIVNLYYEPFPNPMSIEELNNTSTYASTATFMEFFSPSLIIGNDFSFEVKLGTMRGIYHIRIWVTVNEVQIQTADVIVIVE